MKYLKDIDYYDIDKGIEYLQKNKLSFYPKDDSIIIYHVYWYGDITRKQLLPIKSYLKTQDLKKTVLWVWLDFETYSEKNINLIPKHKNILIKKYIPNEQAKDTVLENNKIINNKIFLKLRSDLARILFLNNYGGLYFDLDMILLKDLLQLLGIEFCYCWSLKKTGNNGILRLFKNSEECKKLINKYKLLLQKKKFTVWFNDYIFTKDINIMCFPSVLFDPVWILNDKKIKSKYSNLNNFNNFFKQTNENLNNFFLNEIYTYHWHSRNNMSIENNSYFNKFESKLKI